MKTLLVGTHLASESAEYEGITAGRFGQSPLNHYKVSIYSWIYTIFCPKKTVAALKKSPGTITSRRHTPHLTTCPTYPSTSIVSSRNHSLCRSLQKSAKFLENSINASYICSDIKAMRSGGKELPRALGTKRTYIGWHSFIVFAGENYRKYLPLANSTNMFAGCSEIGEILKNLNQLI